MCGVISLRTGNIRPFLLMMGCFRKTTGDEEEKVRKETNKKIEKQLQKDKQLYRATHRLLLLGKLGMLINYTRLNANCFCHNFRIALYWTSYFFLF